MKPAFRQSLSPRETFASVGVSSMPRSVKHQPVVVDPELVEQRRVQVRNAHRVDDGLVAELVAGAVDIAALEPAAGEEEAETIAVMVAPIRVLGDRQPAEFAGPHHDRLVEQTRAISGR